ncbi:MAG: arylsulfatase B [Woeseiaceae bacterium]
MRIKSTFQFTTFLVVTTFCTISDAATNLVIFVADDMGWGDVGYHGSEIRTPAIDQLAAEGVALERFYVHPACSPTRGALMTGRSPLNTGVLIPFEPWFSTGLPLDEKLLPEFLSDAGYQTFAVGKWHLGPNRLPYLPTSRGFDHFYGHLGGFINYEEHTYWRGIDWQRNGKTVIEEGYSTNLIADEAVRLIKSRDKDEPLFLFVSFNAPHSPLQAPLSAVAEYADIRDPHRRTYAAMVSEMDRGIGRVLSTLDAEGLDDNTLVMFMSDNGGSTRLGANNGALRGGKVTTWEGGIRVPAVLRWPGRINAGSKFAEMITVEDILPTLVNALDIRADWPNPLDGINQWMAITENQLSEDRLRILAMHDRQIYRAAVFEGGWKLVQMSDGEGDPLPPQLFRIGDDPNERNDMAADHPDIVESMLSHVVLGRDVKIVGIDDETVPTRLGLGGPASALPDNRPPAREPYAESTLPE